MPEYRVTFQVAAVAANADAAIKAAYKNVADSKGCVRVELVEGDRHHILEDNGVKPGKPSKAQLSK